MYVTEKVQYVGYDESSDTASDVLEVKGYTLVYSSNSITEVDGGSNILYTVNFEAYKDGEYIGTVSPAVNLSQKTQQQKLEASVISLPTEDLFVVYRGVNDDGAFSMDVRINPLISLVWIGFGLLMIGVLVAASGRRSGKKTLAASGDSGEGAGSSADTEQDARKDADSQAEKALPADSSSDKSPEK